MRVISGEAKGRRLKAPKGFATRPTTDRVKEAIFNVLSAKIPGSAVLDVFAGTGGLGIEALSRGATLAHFIEKNREAASIVQNNLVHTGLSPKAQVLQGDFAFLLARLKERYDLIFLDPPYHQGFVLQAVSLIIKYGLLSEHGVIIIETGSKEKELPQEEELVLVKESVYGDTAVLYYQFR
ncbi:16S rRNA (guanine(966)-N(2))-methyltransferase RsmD [Dehalobacterium formicoaceticum]|uniref:16S rRNA (Guanine(966)-N(2))-methyltransferase RsmD n=1 Tax=Dehalobacterium formicoaceticum TaxID=51515 RepID=A0ABT1Y5Z9_9FIRM|nr:16S rRNA (guanine(966)-N(2))-methyltransferase RsmD [Dehalobacterium formicoaceticum]MCR6546299.1 16S rRNA (guanine(966)-N(2))-methyltransferase RsmD [Dehalobacterium formicoaceticum]